MKIDTIGAETMTTGVTSHGAMTIRETVRRLQMRAMTGEIDITMTAIVNATVTGIATATATAIATVAVTVTVTAIDHGVAAVLTTAHLRVCHHHSR
jgi:hypothetical protein